MPYRPSTGVNTFDALNRLASVTDPAGRITRYEYAAASRPKRILYGNGTEALYSFDSVGSLKELINRKTTGEVISSHKYGLDPTGMRTRITEKDSVVDYGYDRLNRLISERRTGSVNYEAAYTYDAVGNRLTKRATDGNFDYNYDANDRLQSDGVNSYTWDNNGNMIGKNGPGGATNYVYDPENRLIEAGTPSGLTRFNYDASGNRIARTTGTGITQFLVDTNMSFAQVLEESNGATTTQYIHGYDLISRIGSNGTRWYAYDGLGSTRGLTNDSGTLIDEYVYEGFGSVIKRTGASANEFMFTGEQFEPGLGMYYLRARFYEVGTGRFTQRDDYPNIIYYPSTLHRYNYTEGNPINYIDPSGKTNTLIEFVTSAPIAGMLAGMAGYTITYFVKRYLFNDETCKWSWMDLFISGALGAIGNGVSGAFQFTIAKNIVWNAFLSAIGTSINSMYTGDWNAGSLIFSIITGGIAGRLGGEGATAFSRGVFVNISPLAVSIIMDTAKYYVTERIPEMFEYLAIKISNDIDSFKTWVLKMQSMGI